MKCRPIVGAALASAPLILSGPASADFVGLKTDDRYLFGSGMDYKNYLRNIDGIYAVNKP